MYDDILSQNDDDIFDDNNLQSNNTVTSKDVLDSISDENLSDEFKEEFAVFMNSTVKASFVNDFYEAANNFVQNGIKQAHQVSIVNALLDDRNQNFLAHNQIITLRESIVRRKIIMGFILNFLQKKDSIYVVLDKLKLPFDIKIIEIFFKSYYNITRHVCLIDIALYKFLSDKINEPIDSNVTDIDNLNVNPLNFAELMQNLYNLEFSTAENMPMIKQYVSEQFSSQKDS